MVWSTSNGVGVVEHTRFVGGPHDGRTDLLLADRFHVDGQTIKFSDGVYRYRDGAMRYED